MGFDHMTNLYLCIHVLHIILYYTCITCNTCIHVLTSDALFLKYFRKSGIVMIHIKEINTTDFDDPFTNKLLLLTQCERLER